MTRFVRLLWQQRQSPELWLLAANLLARALGFWMSLLVSRLAGVQALGMYSGVLITTASPTTPMASVLANNATILAARLRGRATLGELVRAHGGVLLLSGAVSLLGCGALLALSGLSMPDAVPAALLAVLAAGLVLSQLVTPFVMGLAHGFNRSLLAAGWAILPALLALSAAYAVVMTWGLGGALAQTTLVALLPPLMVVVWLWRERGVAAIGAHDAERPQPLARLANAQFRQALPSVGATVVNNATNWLACIYLAERWHGSEGVGLVAISLQWTALMLMPLTSWNGRVMRALALAHESGPSALRREMTVQIRKCVMVSSAMALGVAAASPWIADLYKADASRLVELFLLNALGAVLFAVTFVFERVIFCLNAQRIWLLASIVAYASQALLTLLLIEHGVWAVALGNVCAITVLMALVGLYLRGGRRGALWSAEESR